MPDINDFNNNMSDVVTGVETVKKGKGGLIAGITAGALAVVVGGGVAAYNLSDFVKNQVKLRISKPENYYAWVNDKNADNLAMQLSEQYRQALDKAEQGQKTSFSLKYDISEDARDYIISDFFYIDEADPDDEEKSLIKSVKNLNSITIGADAEEKGDILAGSVYADFNSSRLITIDAAAAGSDKTGFVRIPELTEKWLGIDAGALLDDSYYYYDDEEKQTLDAVRAAMQNPGEYLSPEELEAEIARYVGVWNAAVEDVQIEKKESITINDITVNYTVASVELDERKADEIVVSFIEAVKNDDILKDLLIDRLGLTDEAEYTDDLNDIIEEYQHDDDYEYDTDIYTISTYIDARGDIRGISFEGKEDEKFIAIIGKDGDQIRGESYLIDGEEEFRIELTAEDNNNKYSGNIDFIDGDDTYSVEFTDFEIVNEEYGYFNTELAIIVPDIDPIGISFTSDGSQQQISADIKSDGKDYGKLTLSFSAENGAEPVIPSKSSAYMIDEENSDFMADYVEQEKTESFISDLLKKLGFDSEVSEEISKFVADDLYNSYDYYDDFDWEDDLNGWDDDDFDIDDFDDDFDDDDFDIDDWYYIEDDLYADDQVTPEDGQAYLAVIDADYKAMYIGFGGEALSYNARVADITGNGTYTIGVTADTDGYKSYIGKKPNGLAVLGIQIDGVEGIADSTSITIKSVKIDGKEIAVTGAPDIEKYDGSISAVIYIDGSDYDYIEYANIIDGASVGEWTAIEVTFEVSGM